jgi:SAM-dependent methyltransferase
VTPAERERVSGEFRRRDRDLGLRDRYGPADPAVSLSRDQLDRRIAALLQRAELLPLDDRAVLEVGCGSGGLLPGLARLGAARPIGVDLSIERLTAARRHEGLGVAQADAAALPFATGAFDLVVQSTVLSSVLDAPARRAIAAEMARVLRPDGRVLWYDFVWNPTNRRTRGVGRRELLALVPGFDGPIERVTLAPPLARLSARISPRLAVALAAVPALRSHQLALLGRDDQASHILPVR